MIYILQLSILQVTNSDSSCAVTATIITLARKVFWKCRALGPELRYYARWTTLPDDQGEGNRIHCNSNQYCLELV